MVLELVGLNSMPKKHSHIGGKYEAKSRTFDANSRSYTLKPVSIPSLLQGNSDSHVSVSYGEGPTD